MAGRNLDAPVAPDRLVYGPVPRPHGAPLEAIPTIRFAGERAAWPVLTQLVGSCCRGLDIAAPTMPSPYRAACREGRSWTATHPETG